MRPLVASTMPTTTTTMSLPRSPLCTYLSDRPDGILVRGSPPAFSLERNHAIPLFVVARPSTVSFHGRLVNTLSPEASTSKRLLDAAYGTDTDRIDASRWNDFNPFPPTRPIMSNFFFLIVKQVIRSQVVSIFSLCSL